MKRIYRFFPSKEEKKLFLIIDSHEKEEEKNPQKQIENIKKTKVKLSFLTYKIGIFKTF